MERQEVFAILRALVADRLALQEDGIALGSRLAADLGADSLDLIDMIFAIEKRFGVKIREGGFELLVRMDFSSPEVVREGALTDDAIAKLREWLPAIEGAPDSARVKPADLFGLITVETLCLLVERRLPRPCGGESTAREDSPA